MAYLGNIVDFVVQQTKVDFATASTTLDAYHGDVVDTINALTCGAGAAAAREDDIIQAIVSSCDAVLGATFLKHWAIFFFAANPYSPHPPKKKSVGHLLSPMWGGVV